MNVLHSLHMSRVVTVFLHSLYIVMCTDESHVEARRCVAFVNADLKLEQGRNNADKGIEPLGNDPHVFFLRFTLCLRQKLPHNNMTENSHFSSFLIRVFPVINKLYHSGMPSASIAEKEKIEPPEGSPIIHFVLNLLVSNNHLAAECGGLIIAEVIEFDCEHAGKLESGILHDNTHLFECTVGGVDSDKGLAL